MGPVLFTPDDRSRSNFHVGGKLPRGFRGVESGGTGLSRFSLARTPKRLADLLLRRRVLTGVFQEHNRSTANQTKNIRGPSNNRRRALRNFHPGLSPKLHAVVAACSGRTEVHHHHAVLIKIEDGP